MPRLSHFTPRSTSPAAPDSGAAPQLAGDSSHHTDTASAAVNTTTTRTHENENKNEQSTEKYSPMSTPELLAAELDRAGPGAAVKSDQERELHSLAAADVGFEGPYYCCGPVREDLAASPTDGATATKTQDEEEDEFHLCGPQRLSSKYLAAALREAAREGKMAAQAEAKQESPTRALEAKVQALEKELRTLKRSISEEKWDKQDGFLLNYTAQRDQQFACVVTSVDRQRVELDMLKANAAASQPATTTVNVSSGGGEVSEMAKLLLEIKGLREDVKASKEASEPATTDTAAAASAAAPAAAAPVATTSTAPTQGVFERLSEVQAHLGEQILSTKTDVLRSLSSQTSLLTSEIANLRSEMEQIRRQHIPPPQPSIWSQAPQGQVQVTFPAADLYHPSAVPINTLHHGSWAPHPPTRIIFRNTFPAELANFQAAAKQEKQEENENEPPSTVGCHNVLGRMEPDLSKREGGGIIVYHCLTSEGQFAGWSPEEIRLHDYGVLNPVKKSPFDQAAATTVEPALVTAATGHRTPSSTQDPSDAPPAARPAMSTFAPPVFGIAATAVPTPPRHAGSAAATPVAQTNSGGFGEFATRSMSFSTAAWPTALDAGARAGAAGAGTIGAGAASSSSPFRVRAQTFFSSPPAGVFASMGTTTTPSFGATSSVSGSLPPFGSSSTPASTTTTAPHDTSNVSEDDASPGTPRARATSPASSEEF